MQFVHAFDLKCKIKVFHHLIVHYISRIYQAGCIVSHVFRSVDDSLSSCLATSILHVFRFRAQIRDGVETNYARPIQILASKRVEMKSSTITLETIWKIIDDRLSTLTWYSFLETESFYSECLYVIYSMC